jgi:hypothetical protein
MHPRVSRTKLVVAFGLGWLPLLIVRPAVTRACDAQFDSTFALIQQAIFEGRGCTSALCHDASASGGLVLLPDVAYANLVDAPVQSFAAKPPLVRVYPGKKENSLLWINLAAATLPDQWKAPLRPMPQGGLPPLTLDELQVVQLWIESGAPETGVVPGTGDLLDACLPPPQPLHTKPLDPPAPGTGIQLRAPHQVLPPHSEREVCFVTYYDVTDQVPDEFRGPGGDTFRYKRIDARMDPLSHHVVVIPYKGRAALDDPIWGPFSCGGGAKDGQPCDPSDTQSCGSDGVCGSKPTPSVACIGYGPGDASIGVGNDSLFNTMAAGLGDVDGVYAEAPLKGMLVWDSHAFDVTDEPGNLDIWINLTFAAPSEQQHPLQRFTDALQELNLIHVPPFMTQEVCAHYEVLPNANVLELSSHNHKRGKRFRIFEGKFACAGGPKPGAPCSPFGPDPGLPNPDPCAGAGCESKLPPAAGDCNEDLEVSVNELVLGVAIALQAQPLSACTEFDANHDGVVSVAELVTAVRAAVAPAMRDPDASLVYTSLTYSDPAVTKFNPPVVMGDSGSSAAQRTYTFCSLYDNGFANPADVKRQSTSPKPTAGFPGGPCAIPTGCTGGQVGASCSGDTPAARDASCDSSPGAGDGVCDACTLTFGVTTEDEMFVLLGAYFMP